MFELLSAWQYVHTVWFKINKARICTNRTIFHCIINVHNFLIVSQYEL